MIVSPNMIKKVRNQIERSVKLQEGELRRVEDMGNLYLSLTDFRTDNGKIETITDWEGWRFWFQYSIEIDGVEYYFYGGSPPTEQTQ